MFFITQLLTLIALVQVSLFAEKVETFYGTLEVEESVLLELIHSPALERLKSIHQYGVAYYTTHQEEYNRFDHSLGVFAFLRTKGASLEEQISGLLHDVSHTVFSHVGDWVFGKEYQEEDYQSTIHRLYLAVSGVEEILNKYGYTIEQILPKKTRFVMLEQSLPNLSADRIDYNLQGAYFQNFLTKEEAQTLFEDLWFTEGRWLTTRKDLAAKLSRFSLYMTENCWGSAVNYVTSRWLADAILHGLKIGLISWNEFHFGIDEILWSKLSTSQDPIIENSMRKVMRPRDYFSVVSPSDATSLIKFRCRGVDPWILDDGKIVRLTTLDPELAQAFQEIKEKASQGWPIKIR